MRIFAICLAFVCAFAVGAAAYLIVALGPAPLGQGLEFSSRTVDGEGRLLRAYVTSEGRWRLPATVADLDPRFFGMLFAYEDKRFRKHHGVDSLALLRAAYQLASGGHIRSGASTLTMQVARLLERRHERSLLGKLRQMVRAIEIERILTKDEILALYLDLAPYGGNLEGVRAAALAYFGKQPRRLSLGEMALLVALPQSPELRRPDRFPGAAREARNRVLDRFAATGSVPADEVARAKAEPMPATRRPMPMLAPHAADRTVAAAEAGSEVRLTIDAALQRSLEELARERARSLAMTLGPDVSLAIMVVDNATGDVLTHVGSPDYFDERRAAQVDMTQALRSPGSTLKPFIYGMGFEDGFIHPETLIEDRPVRYGAYTPQNFDFTFQGTVTVRRALQLSLNIPALAVLDRVGASRLAARLTEAGARLVLPEDKAPGLAIGLGGIGIRLCDLVALYSGLARLGTVLPLRERAAAPILPREAGEGDHANGSGPKWPARWQAPHGGGGPSCSGFDLPPPRRCCAARIPSPVPLRSTGEDKPPLGEGVGRRLLEPVAAWYVGNVLLGMPPPENGVAGRIAFKTGTSYGYRDAWSIGFDGKRTIGVWVGRPDGASVPGLMGRSAAAPILFEAFARTAAPPAALPPPPPGVLMTTSAKLPPPLKRFQPGHLIGEDPRARLHILFPPDGARLDLSNTDGTLDRIPLKVTGAVAPVTVLVNGRPAPVRVRGTLFFQPDGAGFSRVTVIDAVGATASVVLRLESPGAGEASLVSGSLHSPSRAIP